ncbi:hypothetical protein EI42_06375 [Thermosporothrix hazakensis]|jgi:MGT family glycosyltransferase|uniref:MGT family glycosyltransferase n=2 Tax=Thermosporothrix TaxID=768650 RepID=A0A326TNM9_THEHA|nr:macrolide family glycosyltransferase [Thermosporothrix hazakensis]PZW18061.1 hypothetical protein EI42_06375 [Thermosporothrix hazakensis]BBH85327.1 glycosyl transferase family 1 [Thermosporothrix sp. COM3]GCE46242.1 glycosyl transferase family 1 [Thermosporothrix hazakensis]
MGTIVFLGSPAFGHVNPTLPLAQELVQRGEQIIYYNHEEFRRPIEQTGSMFYAYPETEISATSIGAALRGGNLANLGSLLLAATENLLPYLLDHLPRHRPDLIIFDSMALWGKMVATLLNLRAASSISHFVYDPSHLMSEGAHSMRYLWQILPQLPSVFIMRSRLIRKYRRAFPKERPLLPLRGSLNLVFTLRALQPKTTLIDETFRFVGPSINPQIRSDAFFLPTERKSPIVYISLGTIHTRQMEFYQRCFAAFGDYPAQFILSTGNGTAIEKLGAIPSNFIVRSTVPQLKVLEQTNIFITHGGMNSIHEGLYYGVPLILVPYQLEQRLNARIIVKQGAGLLVERAAGEPPSIDNLRRALDAIFSDPRYQKAARRLQQLFQETGGYQQAADEVQSYYMQRG